MKKQFALLIVLVLSSGMLIAKGKVLPLKKFQSTDIGKPALTGSTTLMADGISLTAGGADIWGVRDEFRFCYLEQTGDFDLVARIESLNPGPGAWMIILP